MVSHYGELEAYKKAISNAVRICKLANAFPNFEQWGIAQQIRRSAVSIPSNIAEGFRRGTKEYKQFLRIALGSSSELETQLVIGHELEYLSEDDFNAVYQINDEVARLLVSYLKQLN